jgi:DNA-binding response OmpR family regulator
MNSPGNLIAVEGKDVGSALRAPCDADVTTMRVAIVGDDRSQAQLLSQWLRQAGHQSHHFHRGQALIHALSRIRFDVLVLDWNLGDISGMEVLRRIRNRGQRWLPVLFASMRGREADVVSALRQGADDYMIKPVHNFEFIARLEAIVRRGNHRTRPDGLKLDVYYVDYLSRRLMRDGRLIELTAKDFDLSVLFLLNVGQLLSRGHICAHVWGRAELVTSRTLDTHVSRVRRKLALIPENGWCLDAKYGYGYRLQKLGAVTTVSLEPRHDN